MQTCTLHTLGTLLGAACIVSVTLMVGCSAELIEPEAERPGPIPAGVAGDVAIDSAGDAPIADIANDLNADDADADGGELDVMDVRDIPPDLTRQPRYCADLPRSNPTGMYTFDPDGDGMNPIDVYCEMDTDGGGWTLIGRSDTEGTASGFGWFASTGSWNDFGEPYSLGIDNLPVPFTEVLVGSRNDALVEQVYKLSISRKQVEDCRDMACETGGVIAAFGTRCADTVNPTTFRHFGFTNERTRFFFRDTMSNGDYGLRTGTWNVAASDCQQGGNIDGRAGQIFVR